MCGVIQGRKTQLFSWHQWQTYMHVSLFLSDSIHSNLHAQTEAVLTVLIWTLKLHTVIISSFFPQLTWISVSEQNKLMKLQIRVSSDVFVPLWVNRRCWLLFLSLSLTSCARSFWIESTGTCAWECNIWTSFETKHQWDSRQRPLQFQKIFSRTYCIKNATWNLG